MIVAAAGRSRILAIREAATSARAAASTTMPIAGRLIMSNR